MKYVLIERQNGGCDYTIGCGIRVTDMKAQSMFEAQIEAIAEIGHSWRSRDEGEICHAKVLEVTNELDLASALDEAKAHREQAEAEADKAKQDELDAMEFERLRRKLGK